LDPEFLFCLYFNLRAATSGGAFCAHVSGGRRATLAKFFIACTFLATAAAVFTCRARHFLFSSGDKIKNKVKYMLKFLQTCQQGMLALSSPMSQCAFPSEKSLAHAGSQARAWGHFVFFCFVSWKYSQRIFRFLLCYYSINTQIFSYLKNPTLSTTKQKLLQQQ